MDSSPLLADTVTETLSLLPLECLLRFRTVCKFWRDVIDCPAFRKSHIANYKNDNDHTTSIMLFKYSIPGKRWESSMILRDTGISFDVPALVKFLEGVSRDPSFQFKVVGPVAGLICIHGSETIAVCNPFLDELKILPLHPVCSDADRTDIGISYDDIACDYKVVRLVSCNAPCNLHVSMYSRNTNSWRELAVAGEYLEIIEPIQCSCRNGEVACWRANRLREDVILLLDMKTEVFRVLEMQDYGRNVKIYEKDGKFVLIMQDSSKKWLHVHEGVEENNGVVWRYLKRVRVFGVFDNFLWRSGCVVFHESYVSFFHVPSLKKLILYDYCAEKIVERIEMPSGCDDLNVFEFDGSFVSP